MHIKQFQYNLSAAVLCFVKGPNGSFLCLYVIGRLFSTCISIGINLILCFSVGVVIVIVEVVAPGSQLDEIHTIVRKNKSVWGHMLVCKVGISLFIAFGYRTFF